ncbi:MAG: glycerol-3-phosphate acyltransferase [Bryobacteraceae bacterium]
MTAALGLVIAYLLGDIPFGYLLVKFTTGRDVRASGSGNIGATNSGPPTSCAPPAAPRAWPRCCWIWAKATWPCGWKAGSPAGMPSG